MHKDKRQILESGTIVYLRANDGNRYSAKIDEVIGYGGSCIAYKGYLLETYENEIYERSVIIKEFYPSALDLNRLEDNSLDIPPEKEEMFNQRKNRFSKGMHQSSKYYEMAADSSLPRVFIYGEANKTCYGISDPGVGRTLNQIDRSELSISRVATIMESLCRAILPIHHDRKLYLDCKPDNIFIFSDSLQDHVYLFDFDTIIPEDHKSRTTEQRIPTYSIGWCAPEQLSLMKGRGYRHPELISYSTDIFSMGLVFFWLLTGQKQSKDETKKNDLLRKIQIGEYNWRESSDLCQGISERAINQIDNITKMMLQPDAKIRKDNFFADSMYDLIPMFQELYGLTVGNNPLHGPIYDAIKTTQVELGQQTLDAQNAIESHINATEDKITEEIKKFSLKAILFGTKRHTVLTIAVLAVTVVLFGMLLQVGSIVIQKIVSSSAVINSNFDEHLLLNLKNANHQYEVGLENWRRLDYNRAERDITAARNKIREEISQADTELAKLNNSLGCLYLDMGKYEEAYDYLNNAYVVFRDSNGKNSTEARAVLFSIAQYDYYAGDFDTALQTSQQIIDASDESTDRVILTIVNHFKAMILDAKGEYDAALLVYKEVLSLYNDYLGDGKLTKELTDYTKDPSLDSTEREAYTNIVQRIILTYNNIGQTMIHKGDYEEAITYLQIGLDMALDNIYIGTRNLLTARLYMNLAKAKAQVFNTKEAIEAIDLAMRIERNLFDFEDVYPGLVDVYCIYGDLLYRDNDIEEASEYYNRAITLAKESFGENHLQTAATYYIRGKYEFNEGKYEDAEKDFIRAIEIRRNMLCLNNPETVQYYISLFYIQIKLGQDEVANNSLDEAEYICNKLELSEEYTQEIRNARKYYSDKDD